MSGFIAPGVSDIVLLDAALTGETPAPVPFWLEPGRAGELSVGFSVDGLPGEDRQLMRYALAVARLVQA